MSGLRMVGRITAAFVAAVLIVIVPGLLVAFTALDVATSPGFLRSVVRDTGLVEATMYEVADDLAARMPEDFQASEMPIARLDRKGWELVLSTVFPQEDLERWIEKSLLEFSRWADEGGPFLGRVVMPYGEMVDNMVNDPEQRVLRTITEAQPSCAAGEDPLVGPGGLIPMCRPSAEELPFFYQRLSGRWQENPSAAWAQLWPENVNRYSEDITLAEMIERESQWNGWKDRSGWIVAGWVAGLAREVLVAAMVLSTIVALGLIALLAARDLREALRWAGAPVLAAGLMTLAFGVAVLSCGWAGPGWYGWYTDVSWGMRSAAYDVARLFAYGLFAPLMAQSAILIVIGGTLFGASFLVPGSRPGAKQVSGAGFGGDVKTSQSAA